MSIIFDLDDTLVDTSGSITPNVLAWALDNSGLELPLDELYAMNQEAYSSSEALRAFLSRYGCLESYEAIAELILEAPMEGVKPVPGAIDCVKNLMSDHSLALVTVGKEGRQQEKLIKAGYDPKWFETIKVVAHKGDTYARLIENWNLSPEKILVVGDRIQTDLQPAKELGMTTIHFRWGRGQNLTGSKIDVDYIIDTLDEVRRIANEYKSKDHK